MIDFGVEEIYLDQEIINMCAPFDSYGSIQKELEIRGIEIISSEFERIPQVSKTLDEEKTSEVEKLIEKIEEDDDVNAVYHNMAISL